MTDLNQRFAEHVASQAFVLTLSRLMIVTLEDVTAAADAGAIWRGFGTGALAALERRGLVVPAHNGPDEAEGRRGFPALCWAPTLAGRLTLALCAQAGLSTTPEDGGAVVAYVKTRDAEHAERMAEWDRQAAERAAQDRADLDSRIRLRTDTDREEVRSTLVRLRDRFPEEPA